MTKINVIKNGPYQVKGAIKLKQKTIIPNEKGESVKWKETQLSSDKDEIYLCRCGKSANAPYCDGSHEVEGFDGTCTSSHEEYPYGGTGQIDGPRIILTDKEKLCAYARFCDPNGSVWRLAEYPSGEKDDELAKQEAEDCPSGRLIAWSRKTGKSLELIRTEALGLIEDAGLQISGGIQVEGPVELIDDQGESFPLSNKKVICRCGESGNKPFCDGTHASMKFKANYP